MVALTRLFGLFCALTFRCIVDAIFQSVLNTQLFWNLDALPLFCPGALVFFSAFVTPIEKVLPLCKVAHSSFATLRASITRCFYNVFRHHRHRPKVFFFFFFFEKKNGVPWSKTEDSLQFSAWILLTLSKLASLHKNIRRTSQEEVLNSKKKKRLVPET